MQYFFLLNAVEHCQTPDLCNDMHESPCLFRKYLVLQVCFEVDTLISVENMKSLVFLFTLFIYKTFKGVEISTKELFLPVVKLLNVVALRFCYEHNTTLSASLISTILI